MKLYEVALDVNAQLKKYLETISAKDLSDFVIQLFERAKRGGQVGHLTAKVRTQPSKVLQDRMFIHDHVEYAVTQFAAKWRYDNNVDEHDINFDYPLYIKDTMDYATRMVLAHYKPKK